MKTLKISLISFTFLFAAITVASARQNSLGDKLKKAKEAKAANKTAITKPKGNDTKGKDAGMAVKGQGASNTTATKSSTQSAGQPAINK